MRYFLLSDVHVRRARRVVRPLKQFCAMRRAKVNWRASKEVARAVIEGDLPDDFADFLRTGGSSSASIGG